MSAPLLDSLLLQSAVWRGDGRAQVSVPSVPSGYAELDSLLPGNGWPRAALTELLVPRHGIGELSLLAPALRQLAGRDQWIALVSPPHLPYAPALAGAGIDLSRLLVIQAADGADTLWAMEQAMTSGACSAVLGWPSFVNERALRRLQLAAEKGQALGIYVCSGQATGNSLAALRLQLFPASGRLGIRVLKVRGHGIGATLGLAVHPASPSADPIPAGAPQAA